jgi:hypothetical protein
MSTPLHKDFTRFTNTNAGVSRLYSTLHPQTDDNKDTLYTQSPIPIVIKPDYSQFYNPTPQFQLRTDSVRIVSPGKLQVNLTGQNPKDVTYMNKEGYSAPSSNGDYSTVRGMKLH